MDPVTGADSRGGPHTSLSLDMNRIRFQKPLVTLLAAFSLAVAGTSTGQDGGAAQDAAALLRVRALAAG